MSKGLFISFEGTDGTGKSTQIEFLREYFEGKGEECLFLREPGGTAIGERIRDILLDNESIGMASETEALLYAASRAQLVNEVIVPALSEGKNVICDRYVDSSYAYQEFGRGLGEPVVTINDFATGGLMPDVTFLLMADPKVAGKRIEGRSLDRIESEGLSFMEKVSKGYEIAADRDKARFCVIDALKKPEEIAGIIRSRIDALTEDRY